MDGGEVLQKLRKIKQELRKRLKDLKQVYLVGSYARNDYVRGLSDVDVIVVAGDFRNVKLPYRIRMVADLFDFETGVDIIPLTPEEFEQAMKEPSTVREMMKHAVEI